MISEFLFYDEDSSKEEKTNYVNLKIEIRELLNDDFNRKILIDILMDLRKDLSGATLGKLFELYQSLGLHHDSYKKLESWGWHTISKGILELTQMQVEESYGFVAKFINHKRSTIRKQAEMAIITLNNEGLNYFLDTTTYRISEWQQLKILEVLKNKSDFQPPSFQHWLISKNKDVVLFALRLMGHYNQSDGNQALIELLKHKKSEIKAAAINCIKEFYVVEAVETLKLVFWNSTVDVKINILDTLASLGSMDDIEFLKSIAAKESNFNVKSKASASINAIAPMSVMPTLDVQSVDKFKVPADILIETVEQKDEQTTSSDLEEEPLNAFEANVKDLPIKIIEENGDEQMFGPNLSEEPLKEFETNTTDILIEAIEENGNDNLAGDHEMEEVSEIEEEVVSEPMEEIEVDVSIALEIKKEEETVESFIEEPSKNDNTESIIEINPEEIPIKETLKVDFLPLVTGVNKTVVPYSYKIDQGEELVSEELFNIETISEILEQNPVSRIENEESQEEVPVVAEKDFSLEFSKVDFLPIVISEAKTILPYKFDKKPSEEIDAPELFDIKTIFETLEQKDLTSIDNEQTQEETPAEKEIDFSVKPSMLDFLTIVITSETEIDKNESVDNDKLIDLLEIPVIYSQIKSEDSESKASKILSELNELVPLPADPRIENKTQNKEKLHKDSKEPTSINTIDMKKIRKIECQGVEIKTENQESVQAAKQEIEPVAYDDFDEKSKSGEQNALDWILAENEAKGELKEKIKSIVKMQEVPAIKLPKPIFYSEQEANTVALLDDIEALGDEREVPLLQDLLLDQDTLSLHERIQFLIEKVSDTSVLKREPITHNNKDGFSVFEEFFKTADPESQLILLDEIIALGDEKEVGFLKRLINNSSGKVQKKAKICLEGLTAKLVQHGNEEQTEPSETEEILSQSEWKTKENKPVLISKTNETIVKKPSGVFDIDFELDLDYNKEY